MSTRVYVHVCSLESARAHTHNSYFRLGYGGSVVEPLPNKKKAVSPSPEPPRAKTNKQTKTSNSPFLPAGREYGLFLLTASQTEVDYNIACRKIRCGKVFQNLRSIFGTGKQRLFAGQRGGVCHAHFTTRRKFPTPPPRTHS